MRIHDDICARIEQRTGRTALCHVDPWTRQVDYRQLYVDDMPRFVDNCLTLRFGDDAMCGSNARNMGGSICLLVFSTNVLITLNRLQ
jgi:hypothetical protein